MQESTFSITIMTSPATKQNSVTSLFLALTLQTLQQAQAICRMVLRSAVWIATHMPASN
jgi:hypothetical protein